MSRRRTSRKPRAWIWAVALSVLAGCSAAADRDDEGVNEGPNPGGPDGTGGSDRDSWGPPGGNGTGGGEECMAVVAEAENEVQPSDIVLAIDQSGSMDRETHWVKEQLNGFAQQITSSGIDVHVVVIAGKPGSENGFCVPAPLGSGGCPDDNNLPTLLHVDQHVDSHDALQRILQRYPDYQSVLRPEASKHIVVISDDDAEDISAIEFDLYVRSADPSFANYQFHGIVAFDDDCDYAADDGKTYIQLAMMRGGVLGDLCLQDFQPIWNELSRQVIDGSTLACEWGIPEPPEGQVFDPTRVNVKITIDGVETKLGNIPSAAECATHVDAWFYDDPTQPTKVQVCPELCEAIQAADSAAVAIGFGCSTVGAPPR